MSEMIERVARAAYEALMTDEHSVAWVDDTPADMSAVVVDGSIDLLKMARAAIVAMMEPTGAMIDAGYSYCSVEDYEALIPEEVWPLMIDAALKPAA